MVVPEKTRHGTWQSQQAASKEVVIGGRNAVRALYRGSGTEETPGGYGSRPDGKLPLDVITAHEAGKRVVCAALRARREVCTSLCDLAGVHWVSSQVGSPHGVVPVVGAIKPETRYTGEVL